MEENIWDPLHISQEFKKWDWEERRIVISDQLNPAVNRL